MRVTLDTVLSDAEYTAKPGTEYEIADGCVVTMKVPTKGLIKRYQAAYDEAQEAFKEAKEVAAENKKPEPQNETDERMARLVTDGEWPEDSDELIELVVSRVHEDFFTFRLPRLKPPEEYLKRYAQLATQTNGVQGAGQLLQSGIPSEGE